MKTTNDYKQKLQDSIDDYKRHEKLVLEIEPIIHSFKNKQLNKRIATAIEQATGLIVHWQASDNYSGSKRYEMSIWGKNDSYNIDYNNKLSFYYFETLEKLQEDIDRYIEGRNSVMHDVLEQKRVELEQLDYIELEVLKMHDNLQQFIASLTDKKRDFGKISYELKDYIKSQLEV
jgi:3-phenylpropionate/cinnamic acid dioxygenase small subunit